MDKGNVPDLATKILSENEDFHTLQQEEILEADENTAMALVADEDDSDEESEQNMALQMQNDEEGEAEYGAMWDWVVTSRLYRL